MRRHIIILSSIFLWAGRLAAQTGNRAAAVQAISQLAERYVHTPMLSFDVVYRYASEASPGRYLDSLRGSFKMDGMRYWYLLDSTEMLCADKWVVILYREDKIMYLSLAGARAMPANPMAMLDSFLAKKDGLEYGVTDAGGQTKVTVSFGKESSCRQLEYDIDDKTGLLTRMVSVVKSEQLYEPSVRSLVSPGASYAVVETLFTNYHEKSFVEGVFDAGRYFKKEGDAYVCVAPYNQYKIFLGKPGL